MPHPHLLAITLLTAASIAACGPTPTLRYDDLVTDHTNLPPSSDPRAQLFCADETHWVRPLEAAEPLTFEVDLGREPRLVLTWCRPENGRGALSVSAAATATATDSAEPLSFRHEVLGAPQWYRWEIDLGELAGRATTVTLDLDLPSDRRILLRDAYVRHLADEAAGWPRPGVHVEADEQAGEETEYAPSLLGTTVFESRGKTDPKILLVSVDTLRADHVGALTERPPGVPSPTPHLDALVADAEVFSPHLAGASWTKPSHATLLTGYPFWVHGAGGIEGVLGAAVPTLAERLRARGVTTAGLVHDCVWLNPKFGLHRGFEDYRSVKWRSGQIERAAVNWMAAHRDESFFFFLHTFDAHSDFQHLPYEGAGSDAAQVRELFGVPGYGCRQAACASGLLAAIQEGRIEPLPNEAEILDHLYAAGVAEVDAYLGRLFDDLRRLGLYDELTIVVTSDHGEMLLEHGRTLHGHFWEEVLRVPLIVKWAGGERAGRRTATPTSALDVVPTLLALAGYEEGEIGLPGVDLRRPRADRVLVAGEPAWQAIYRGDEKAVFFTANPDRRHLYDLAADPREQRDLATERPERLAELERDLATIHRWALATRVRLGGDATAPADGRLSDEERERLRALGYLR